MHNYFFSVKIRSRFFQFTGLVALVYACFQFASCANIQSPMGGPKDTIPPVLTAASPENNTINFDGNTINLDFNEYIKLNNLNENLIVNPTADRTPIINSKLRRVTVKIKDTLQPNTTYSINFGKAISDVNEGNPYPNFTYTFSTGKYIDSLGFAGKVIQAETGLPDSTLTVILHVDGTDSTVVKEKPMYATRPNGKGIFQFEHLPNKRFYIYALRDEGVKRYTSNQISFAFYDSTVQAGSTDSIELRAFIGEPEEQKKPTGGTLRGQKKGEEDKKITYTASVGNSAQDLLGNLDISFEKPMRDIDTTKIRLTDTLFRPIAINQFIRDTSGKTISLKAAWKDDAYYKLLLDEGFATDSAGNTVTKNDTVDFKSKAESEYGSLLLKFTGVDLSRHPVLQFVENDRVSKSFPLYGDQFRERLFAPGQYKLRILYDDNQNGIWDTGNYWEKRQPEIVIPVTETISVKPNWENEIEIRL